jgi:hypothetical protein
MNIAEHLKHNYTLTRSCKEIGAFGETGEPHIFIDRDVWDRGLVVPAYSKGRSFEYSKIFLLRVFLRKH